MDFQNGNAWLNDVRDAVRAGELVEPPEWVKERARRLFQRLTPASSATPTIINRIRAALVRDSRRMGVAPAGVRSLGALGGPWQLLYRGGNVDVDLMVRPNQDGRTINIRGQALAIEGHTVGTGIVEALPADQPRRLQGQHEAALVDYSHAGEVYRRLRRPGDAARSDASAVDSLRCLGRPTQALRLAARARRIFNRLGEELRAAVLDEMIGLVYMQQNDFARALRLFDRARPIVGAVGHPLDLATLNNNA